MKLRYGEVIDLCLHRDTVSLLMERIAILTLRYSRQEC